MGTKKFYETDSFKSLQDDWDKKLEESGFEDIETRDGEYSVEPQKFKTNKSKFTGGIDHYQYCQSILQNYRFPEGPKGDLHRAIFEHYAEGRTMSEIESWIKTQDTKPLSRMRINQIINQIKQNYGRG